MRVVHRWAVAIAAACIGAAAVGLWAPARFGWLLLVAASLPIAILVASWGWIGGDLPVRALVGGATIGVGVALLSHAVVLLFAYSFFLGFADRATDLLDSLRVDPRVTEVLRSPWAILFMVEVVVVAPLTEEVGKMLGARRSRPSSGQAAFLAGVAAGAGFAVVENVMYALGGALTGGWSEILLVRMLGVAVHPLAGGIVMMGWWEWRHGGQSGVFLQRFLVGAGVHALWNGSLVVLLMADWAYELSASTVTFAAISLVYAAALGAITGFVLWRITIGLARHDRALPLFDLGDGRVLTGLALVGASLLIPLTMLFRTFPGVYGG